MKKIINKFETIKISKIIYQDRLRKVSDVHVELELSEEEAAPLLKLNTIALKAAPEDDISCTHKQS